MHYSAGMLRCEKAGLLSIIEFSLILDLFIIIVLLLHCLLPPSHNFSTAEKSAYIFSVGIKRPALCFSLPSPSLSVHLFAKFRVFSLSIRDLCSVGNVEWFLKVKGCQLENYSLIPSVYPLPPKLFFQKLNGSRLNFQIVFNTPVIIALFRVWRR